MKDDVSPLQREAVSKLGPIFSVIMEAGIPLREFKDDVVDMQEIRNTLNEIARTEGEDPRLEGILSRLTGQSGYQLSSYFVPSAEIMLATGVFNHDTANLIVTFFISSSRSDRFSQISVDYDVEFKAWSYIWSMDDGAPPDEAREMKAIAKALQLPEQNMIGINERQALDYVRRIAGFVNRLRDSAQNPN